MDKTEMLPETFTTTLYVNLCLEGWNFGNLEVWGQDMAGDGRIAIMNKEITFKIPKNINIRGEAVKNLEAEKEKTKAEFHIAMKGIQDKIDSLLSIEHHATE